MAPLSSSTFVDSGEDNRFSSFGVVDTEWFKGKKPFFTCQAQFRDAFMGGRDRADEFP
jgi:hypothetical protein